MNVRMISKLTLAVILLLFVNELKAQDYPFYVISNDKDTEEAIVYGNISTFILSLQKLETFPGTNGGNYMALSPDNKHLLVTSFNATGTQSGLIQYAVAEDGKLSQVGNWFKSNNDLPCYVAFTKDMQHVLSANYGDDEISLYSFKDNLLSPESDVIKMEDQSKGHYIHTDPSGQYVHAVFLGQDKVFNYTIEEDAFKPNNVQPYFALPAGYGPRHMVFHPDGNTVYILNELNSSVTVCSYNPSSGSMSERQNISTLPSSFTDWNSGAAIRIHPNGKFLYTSNRGFDGIAVFSLNEIGDITSVVEHEQEGINFPRDFNVSPDGAYMLVANQKGDDVILLTIDPETGELTNTGAKLNMPSPVAIVFFNEQLSSAFGAPVSDLPGHNPIIFPNPVSSTLCYENCVPGTAIQIIDARGTIVAETNSKNGKNGTIPLSQIENGFYMVTFRNVGLRSIATFIKQSL